MNPYTCTGCVRQPIGGRRVSPKCMKCRRMQYKANTANPLPDYYEPAHVPDKPHIKQEPVMAYAASMLASHARITPETTGVPTMLTEKDIFNWMTKCGNREALMRLSRYAQRRVSDIDTPARTIPPIP